MLLNFDNCSLRSRRGTSIARRIDSCVGKPRSGTIIDTVERWKNLQKRVQRRRPGEISRAVRRRKISRERELSTPLSARNDGEPRRRKTKRGRVESKKWSITSNRTNVALLMGYWRNSIAIRVAGGPEIAVILVFHIERCPRLPRPPLPLSFSPCSKILRLCVSLRAPIFLQRDATWFQISEFDACRAFSLMKFHGPIAVAGQLRGFRVP